MYQQIQYTSKSVQDLALNFLFEFISLIIENKKGEMNV